MIEWGNLFQWIEQHPNTAAWVQGGGTFIAASIALIAAFFAYQGAIAQSRAPLIAQRREWRERQRSLAAALWAELSDNRLRLVAIQKDLKASKVSRPSMLPLRQLGTEVYRANLSQVGNLPSEEAWAVVQIYKTIIDFDDQFKKLLGSTSEGTSLDFAANLADSLGGPLEALAAVLRVLSETASLHERVQPMYETAFKGVSELSK